MGFQLKDTIQYEGYYVNKRLFGWAVKDSGFYSVNLFSWNTTSIHAFIIRWKRNTHSILIFDTKLNKVTDLDGTPYEQHEFMQGDTKVYAYISPVIYSENVYEEMLMFNWRKVRLRDIS